MNQDGMLVTAKVLVTEAANDRNPRPLRTSELLGVLKVLVNEVQYLRGYTETLKERLDRLEKGLFEYKPGGVD